MRVMVTGGAGYVGSIVAERLLEKGHDVLVVDNLKMGHREAVPAGAEFLLADIGDAEALGRAFRGRRVDAVMHMAADSIVELSMKEPARCFRNNVANGLELLTAMLEHDVGRLIFSSSAAVYGMPDVNIIREDQATAPVNAYGESKLVFERLLAWYERAYGLKHVSLRYFNAAGASREHGEDHRPETHLIPNLLNAAMNKEARVNIFGTDYPTRDGTCVRDYVHVVDIAAAHILALDKIDNLEHRVYNLGNGEGYSVMEVVAAAKRVTGADILTETGPRRVGDPAVLLASSQLAGQELGWTPAFPDIDSILDTAWEWLKRHPQGYGIARRGGGDGQ